MNFQRTNTKISLLEDYYSHFDEDHRLKTKHGQVEFITAIKYIKEVLDEDLSKKILDIGAGTGAYSCFFDALGYNVTALELVSYNIEVFKKKNSNVNIIQGNALDISVFEDNSFDVTLLFGPMYHLLDDNDKIKALKVAKRVTKNNGVILVSYYMNEYAIITYGFVKKNILDAKKNHQIDETYHMNNLPEDLYSMVRLDDIDNFNKEVGLQRIKIVGQDGPSNYIRTTLNSLSKEEFDEFVSYHLATCERYELLGANSHVLDILKVIK